MMKPTQMKHINIFSEHTYKDQKYVPCVWSKYETKDGRTYAIVHWYSQCADCEAWFLALKWPHHRAMPYRMNRNCEAHKRPGVAVRAPLCERVASASANLDERGKARMTKRQFETIAEIISFMKNEAVRDEAAEHFARELIATNIMFDAALFLNLCKRSPNDEIVQCSKNLKQGLD